MSSQDHLNEFEKQPAIPVSNRDIREFILLVSLIILLWMNYQQRKVIREYEQLFKRIEQLTQQK